MLSTNQLLHLNKPTPTQQSKCKGPFRDTKNVSSALIEEFDPFSEFAHLGCRLLETLLKFLFMIAIAALMRVSLLIFVHYNVLNFSLSNLPLLCRRSSPLVDLNWQIPLHTIEYRRDGNGVTLSTSCFHRLNLAARYDSFPPLRQVKCNPHNLVGLTGMPGYILLAQRGYRFAMDVILHGMLTDSMGVDGSLILATRGLLV
jgi:hypothetical protein